MFMKHPYKLYMLEEQLKEDGFLSNILNHGLMNLESLKLCPLLY